MFIYIGRKKSIPLQDVVGIFSATTLQNETTNEFIRMAGEEGFLEGDDVDPIKSFIIANERVYFSAVVPSTLYRRSLSRISKG